MAQIIDFGDWAIRSTHQSRPQQQYLASITHSRSNRKHSNSSISRYCAAVAIKVL